MTIFKTIFYLFLTMLFLGCAEEPSGGGDSTDTTDTTDPDIIIDYNPRYIINDGDGDFIGYYITYNRMGDWYYFVIINKSNYVAEFREDTGTMDYVWNEFLSSNSNLVANDEDVISNIYEGQILRLQHIFYNDDDWYAYSRNKLITLAGSYPDGISYYFFGCDSTSSNCIDDNEDLMQDKKNFDFEFTQDKAKVEKITGFKTSYTSPLEVIDTNSGKKLSRKEILKLNK